MHAYIEVKVTTQNTYRMTVTQKQINKMDAEEADHLCYDLRDKIETCAIHEKHLVESEVINQRSHIYVDD